MRIKPYKPLILPGILLVIFTFMAVFIESFGAFDSTIIRIVRQLPRSWEDDLVLLTRIGDINSLIVVSFAVSLYELIRRHYVRSLVMIMSLSAMPAFYIVKEIVRRVRPVAEFVAAQGLQGYSFPSGHSTSTMAVYGTIAILAYSHAKAPWRGIVVSVCIVIILTVSFSRVYLGAHFPSDVVAGWLLGIVIISLLRTLSLFIAARRSKPDKITIEDTTETPRSIQP